MVERPFGVIVAGGEHECVRLGEEYAPVLLVPAGGKPLIERHLERLKSAGVESIALCLGVKADKVRAHCGDGSRFGVRLRYLIEETHRGSAGSVKALGAASLPENIVVLQGDFDDKADLRKLLAFHESHQGLATLALHAAKGRAAVENPVVLGPSRSIVDFPLVLPEGAPRLGTAPLWVIRRQLLHYAPDGRSSDFLKDVFPAALRAGELLLGWHQVSALAGSHA